MAGEQSHPCKGVAVGYYVIQLESTLLPGGRRV